MIVIISLRRICLFLLVYQHQTMFWGWPWSLWWWKTSLFFYLCIECTYYCILFVDVINVWLKSSIFPTQHHNTGTSHCNAITRIQHITYIDAYENSFSMGLCWLLLFFQFHLFYKCKRACLHYSLLYVFPLLTLYLCCIHVCSRAHKTLSSFSFFFLNKNKPSSTKIDSLRRGS